MFLLRCRLRRPSDARSDVGPGATRAGPGYLAAATRQRPQRLAAPYQRRTQVSTQQLNLISVLTLLLNSVCLPYSK